jgi:hypothetical protein
MKNQSYSQSTMEVRRYTYEWREGGVEGRKKGVSGDEAVR